MKYIASCLLIFALAGMWGKTMAENTSPTQISEELRAMVLNLNPSEIGLSKENFPHPIFAVVMETGFPEGSFTLSAIADGTTSLYFSNGGGIIGGGEHENVREATGYLLSGAQNYYKEGKKVTSYPLPEPGKVVFYFVSFDGVYSYSALEDDLGNERDKLSNLFFAAHNVITELRSIEEKSHNNAN